MKETAYFERFTLDLFPIDAADCSAGGRDAEPYVRRVIEIPYVRKQLDRISDVDLCAELKGYGAWNADELSDREANERRIVWIAAGDIMEGA